MQICKKVFKYDFKWKTESADLISPWGSTFLHLTFSFIFLYLKKKEAHVVFGTKLTLSEG